MAGLVGSPDSAVGTVPGVGRPRVRPKLTYEYLRIFLFNRNVPGGSSAVS